MAKYSIPGSTTTRYAWRCPFCGHNATISLVDREINRFEFDLGNRYGKQECVTSAVCCPNSDCKEFALKVYLFTSAYKGEGNWELIDGIPRERHWDLIPEADMKVFPNYVPEAIRADYREACLIKTHSPKASATLSRRCLQGMIRDFWGVKNKLNLYQEIEAISDKVDGVTWEAIHSVREIGNIGAHMEKDIGLIVEVDPNEAQLLIELIETLIEEWYIARHDRKKRMEGIRVAASTKKEAKKPNQENNG